jgi:predicted membrane channel-forming protein YqfA (hemolysin III family)
MANNTSQHIIGPSTSLLGFCLVVITSFHLTDKSDSSIIDEFTSGIAMMLILSCIFSFIAIRANDQKKISRLESIAEYIFLLALIGIMLIILLLVFKFIR